MKERVKMQKIKRILGLVSGLIMASIIFVKPVMAISPTVTITELSEFTVTNNFKISYSALTSDPSAISAQFYFMKEGGSYQAFGSAISGASGQIEVTANQMDEQMKKYYFKVEIAGASEETSTFYDASGPSPVNSYWKERISSSLMRLHWKTPSDDDFSRVFVYRGEVSGFTADGSTKIGEVGGAKDIEVSWDNIVDSDKEYFYALRAIDKAGNASSLVGDAGVIAGSVQGESTSLEEKAVIIPVEKTEEPEGQVLPAETEAPKTLGKEVINIAQDIAQFAKDRTKITVGIGLGMLAIIGLIVYFFKKK
jgi:hypothetical protein